MIFPVWVRDILYYINNEGEKRIVMILEIWYYKPTYEHFKSIKVQWNFNFPQFLVGEHNMRVHARTHTDTDTDTHEKWKGNRVDLQSTALALFF